MQGFITGLAGSTLSAWERDFLNGEQPAGLILFARNVVSPHQVSDLISEALDALGDPKRLVMVDQEGGRVRRLKPPHWPAYPPGADIGAIYDRGPEEGLRAAYLAARLMAEDLRLIGFNMNCLPVLDCRHESTTDAIGDRAFSGNPDTVGRLGDQARQGCLDGGILPIAKHMPGHGRAVVDSHHFLPRVDASLSDLIETDFKPFKHLNTIAMGMTAHIVFRDIDPDRPATQSARVIETVVRGEIGFQGLLFSDDISMKALGGDVRSRCALALEAGCDMILHCNGDPDEMKAAAAAAQDVEGVTAERLDRAMAGLRAPDAVDIVAMRAEFSELLSPIQAFGS